MSAHLTESWVSPLLSHVGNQVTVASDPSGLEIVLRGSKEDREKALRLLDRIRGCGIRTVTDILAEIENSRRKLVITLVRGDRDIPIADYRDPDNKIDMWDVEKFEGLLISPEAVFLHELVEKWWKMTSRPQMQYPEAHDRALDCENAFGRYRRGTEVKGLGVWTWDVTKDGKLFRISIFFQDKNATMVRQYEVKQ